MRSTLAQFLFCVFSALLCAEMSMARDFDSAMRAYENKDYSTALKEFTAVAVQGNQEAQLIVGKMYMIGQGVEKDSEQAIKWFKVAAGQGNADAQFFLGAMYLLPERDITEGLKWVRLAAEQGMHDAQFLLGMAYLKGQNFARDSVQADMWLRLAAAHGGEFYRSQLDEAEKQLTPDQIAQAKALVAAWKPNVAAVPSAKQE
jgi:uncharacterized protein